MVRFINETFGVKDFIVYELDTQKSIIERLADELGTIPKYLYFSEGIPSYKRLHDKERIENIRVEDLLKTITDDDDFEIIVEKLKEKLSQQKLKLLEDVFIPYIAYNKSINDVLTAKGDVYSLFLSMSGEIKTANIFGEVSPSQKNIEKYWDERKKTIKDLTHQIESVKENVAVQKKLFKDFDMISKTNKYTNFDIKSVDFNFTLDLKNITIMEIFNYVQLNPMVPFACINKFFKILKDFTPPVTWGFSLDSEIIFKVLKKKDLISEKPSDYTEAIVSVTGDLGEEITIVSMTTFFSTNGQFLLKEQLIQRFLDSIKISGINVIPENIKESRVNGTFYFPNQKMNKYIIADIIMNNPVFSSLMSVDESEKATKKKDSVYIHFYNHKIGNLTANLTEQVTGRNDPELRGKKKSDFKKGSSYIRVKITSAKNEEAVQDFQNLFAKLMVVYEQEYPNIVKFYTSYISDFVKTKKIKNVPNIIPSLKDIAPEVFAIGYPQRCPQAPTIIDDDDKLALDTAIRNGNIMRYPKEEDSTEQFPSRNYICEHKDAEFPGLRINPLDNNNIVPYLPCCYKKNHNIPGCGSILRYYEHGEDLKEKGNEEQQDIIITKRFAPQAKYGTLPENIEKLFEIFDFDEKYRYFRRGMHNGKSSFLECVMEGMETEILDIKFQKREAFLVQKRKELANKAGAASCKQEMYDYSTQEIIDAIRDPNTYMDPLLFTSLLEQHFNCNIFVFNRTHEYGKMNIPRHTQAYYKNKRDARCIFIYEHTGSHADRGKYEGSHCELIVRWKKNDKHNITYFSPYDSEISKGMREIFNRMKKAYALNLEITETSIPLEMTSNKFFEQGIDSYGKCRMLRFKIGTHTGTLLTDPMQPFSIPEVKDWVSTTIPKKIAMKFARFIGLSEESGQCVTNDILKEIYYNLGNVKITIPVDDDIPIKKLIITNDTVSYATNYSSALDNHNKYKKLARYVTEYMFWLFSKYLQEDTSRIPLASEPDIINKFAQEKIKIDSTFEYKKVDKIFKEKSGVMKKGKLIVKSEETLKRLIYTLRLALRLFGKKIEKYHELQTINSFYLDVTDFDQYPHQVVLYGEDSVEKWNIEKKIKYTVHNSVQSILDVPYFFQNILIDDQEKVYLAQNTINVKKAIEIAKNWIESGYNIGSDPKDSDDNFAFNLFRYINSKDIVLHKITGVLNTHDINILGYKINGKSFFTVLLQL